MHKKQQDRKARKNFTPELFERFFRRNEGTTDHATIPSVTLAANFVIEFSFTANEQPSPQMAFGNEDNSSFFEIQTGGRIRFRALGVPDLTSG